MPYFTLLMFCRYWSTAWINRTPNREAAIWLRVLLLSERITCPKLRLRSSTLHSATNPLSLISRVWGRNSPSKLGVVQSDWMDAVVVLPAGTT